MTKEELEKEARTECFMLTVNTIGIDQRDVELAYIMGAEPREKHIAELEAEVKEWKDKADLWCKTANLKDHNIMINKELEKENAELKETVIKMNNVITETFSNLTKAKELLKETQDYIEYIDDVLYDEIEQFLNSEVEK